MVALPPLNLVLARDLVARSHFAEETPATTGEALESAASRALVRLSQLLTDIDAVVGVELDPLFVETSGVVVLDVAHPHRPGEAQSRAFAALRFAPIRRNSKNRSIGRAAGC